MLDDIDTPTVADIVDAYQKPKFGDALREIMLSRGINASKLALAVWGVNKKGFPRSVSIISQIMQNKRLPIPSTRKKIIAYLKLDDDALPPVPERFSGVRRSKRSAPVPRAPVPHAPVRVAAPQPVRQQLLMEVNSRGTARVLVDLELSVTDAARLVQFLSTEKLVKGD